MTSEKVLRRQTKMVMCFHFWVVSTCAELLVKIYEVIPLFCQQLKEKYKVFHHLLQYSRFWQSCHTNCNDIQHFLKMEVPDWQGGNLFLGVALQVATLLHQIITTFSIFLVKKVLLCTHLYIDPNWTRISNFFCSFCYKMINDIEDCVSGQYLRGSQAFISAAFFLTLLFEFLKSHHLSKQRTVRSGFLLK